ncbi:MAG: ribonuclease Z [Bacteroidetes bacterium]|nr:MAG: ribonuclease Z [Bacteroidota bacterium]
MSKNFQVYILGCSAATPTSERHTTAQVLNYHNNYFLLDCAEGSQMQMRGMRLPLMKINHIFISHLHGDHYLGLPGLLFSYHLLGKKNNLNIYAPAGLKEIIETQFRISELKTVYPITFHLIKEGRQLLYEDKNITVESIEMLHRLPTYGFLIKEKPALRNMRKDAIEKYNIPVEKINNIKSGKDFITEEGLIIENQKLTIDPPVPRSYAFCSDTGYTENYIEQIRNADLLYHEATFLHDKVDLASEKTHCTTIEAATIAQKSQVKKLMIGHYSARYDNMKLFEEEARTVFPNTILAQEGMCVKIGDNEKGNII